MQARDGNLYSVNFYQDLNGHGTAFRLAPDGSGYRTLTSFPTNTLAGASDKVDVFGDDDQGNVEMLSSVMSGGARMIKLTPGTPLTTGIVFSSARVAPGGPVQLTRSSTGAASCSLLSDIPGVAGPAASSGTETVALPPLRRHAPPIYTAGLQCHDASYNFSSAGANVLLN